MRYYNLRTYLRRRYGRLAAKISLDAGLSCPNRDGTLGRRGCLFCGAGGSGSGASGRGLDLRAQIEGGLERAGRRADRFILYFQSYTNTYAPLDRLRAMWDLALDYNRVVGLAVGTRPDCVPDDVLDLLASYAESKEVWLELGLQSATDRTLALIERGHTVDDFARAARRAAERNLLVVAHVIIGLPGEGPAEDLATARLLTELDVFGVKIHSLYVSAGAGLAELTARGGYDFMTQEEFAARAAAFLEHIPPGMVVHRLTGDPDPRTLVGPRWSLEKSKTIGLIRKRLEDLDAWQGRALGAARPDYS